MRRLFVSWRALSILLVTFVAIAAVALLQLQQQVAGRVQEGAIETASAISVLTVGRDLTVANFGELALADSQRTDLDDDVAALRAQDRLVGLEVWSADGQLLYADQNHPSAERSMPADELARSTHGMPWVAETARSEARGLGTLDVFVPHDSDRDGIPEGVVEVLLPEGAIAGKIERSTLELLGAGALLLVLVATALLVLRSRLLARDRALLRDPLTGLANRSALRREAARVIAGVDTAANHRAALLMLDLDGFKTINDTLGHPAGDELLGQVARALRSVVDPTDLVARLGGDEFAITLARVADADDAVAAVSRILGALRRAEYQVKGIELSVDASIGVAMIPAHGTDVDRLLQHADVAMYEAKRGRTGVAVYDPGSDPHDVTRLGLLVELRRAIAADELVLHFQPQLDLGTRRMQGVEALVRWQHPTRGLLPPSEFIAVAENTGLMKPLTEWVLRHAFEQAAAWRAAGMSVPIAVNISPRSLLDRDLPVTVLRYLAEASLPAHLLELEVTETAIMTDPNRAADVLRNLAALGLRVSIDDFGVGYTSLAYLKTLPVHALKIDQCFVAGMLHSEADLAIAETIINLGHKLGLEVLAEGIEDRLVLNRLTRLGCDSGQGYFIARPMPAGELAAWQSAWVERELGARA